MTERQQGGIGAGGLLASVIAAAAIGAGAALLLAPEEGPKTRRRVERRLRTLRGSARGGLDTLRREASRRRHRRERRTTALIATLAGLAMGALFTPDGSVTRRRLGRQLNAARRTAQERVRELRHRERNGAPADSATASRSFTEQFEQPRTPVRSAQELGRDPDELI